MDRFGTMQAAFSVWDGDGSGEIDEAEFRAACDEVGFAGNQRTLFKSAEGEECATKLGTQELT